MQVSETISVKMHPDLEQCVQIFRSVFITTKSKDKNCPEAIKKVSNMSRSKAIEILLLIGLNSKIDPKDSRMDTIRTFLEKGKIYKDRRWYEDLARQVMRGLK